MNDPNLNIAIKYYNWAIFATDDPKWGTFQLSNDFSFVGPPFAQRISWRESKRRNITVRNSLAEILLIL